MVQDFFMPQNVRAGEKITGNKDSLLLRESLFCVLAVAPDVGAARAGWGLYQARTNLFDGVGGQEVAVLKQKRRNR